MGLFIIPNAEIGYYEETGEKGFHFDTIHLPIKLKLWFVSLVGHTCGLCRVVIKTEEGWLFNTSNAATIFNEEAPEWLIKLALVPNQLRIRAFA